MDVDQRTCFICLEGHAEDSSLEMHRCCTQCLASVHITCWNKLRKKQRVTAFLEIIRGGPRTDVSNCVVCRTGTAFVEAAGDIQDFNAMESEWLVSALRGLLGSGDRGSYELPLCSANVLAINLVFWSLCLVCYLGGAIYEVFAPGPVGVALGLTFYFFIGLQLFYVIILHRKSSFGGLLSSFPPDQNAELPINLQNQTFEDPRECLLAFNGWNIA